MRAIIGYTSLFYLYQLFVRFNTIQGLATRKQLISKSLVEHLLGNTTRDFIVIHNVRLPSICRILGNHYGLSVIVNIVVWGIESLS